MTPAEDGPVKQALSPAADVAAFLRRFHDDVSTQIQDPHFVFFNYGLADRDDDCYTWVRPEDHSNRYQLNLVRNMLEHVELAGKTIVDISSGRGGSCYYLLKYTSAGRIIGVDICEGYVAFCRRTFMDDRVHFACGDATVLPLPDASVDVALNVQSSHCYLDFGSFLREAHRILRPGGTLAFADVWNLEMLPLDWGARERQISESGFVITRERHVAAEVFAALKGKDGFVSRLARSKSGSNKALVSQMLEGLEKVLPNLAQDRSSYRIYLLSKASSSLS